MMQNLFKKKLCNQTPLNILNFQPQGASGWQHGPKRLPKGFLLGGPGAPKTALRLKIKDFGGGLVAESFFEEILLLKTDRVFL